jgi:hypothetical protein
MLVFVLPCVFIAGRITHRYIITTDRYIITTHWYIITFPFKQPKYLLPFFPSW